MISLWTPSLQKIETALGGKMRLVGGCVRDYLLGKMPEDIDIATPLVPRTVMENLEKYHIRSRLLAPAHGVVEAFIGGESFEITTLRRDTYTTDGQEKITFITDYRKDAPRRDFTINALYMDREGKIYDYFDGQADLKARVVRFIGEPLVRLREDPLRLLRYIRFWSLFGGEQPDPDILGCCPAIKGLLPRVSRKRLQKELDKIALLPRQKVVQGILVRTGLMSYLKDIASSGRSQQFFNDLFLGGTNL